MDSALSIERPSSAIGGAVRRVARITVGFAFVLAGVMKLLYPFRFVASILEYEIVPPSVAIGLGVFIPWLEVTCGMMLIVAHRPTATGALCLGSLLVFAGAQISVLVRGMTVACGCFMSDEVVGTASITRALLLLFLLMVGFRPAPEPEPGGR